MFITSNKFNLYNNKTLEEKLEKLLHFGKDFLLPKKKTMRTNKIVLSTIIDCVIDNLFILSSIYNR